LAAEDRSTTTATHLLVVEDDAEIGMILRRYFEAQGFRISLARDGGQMRACLAADAVQLVMLDLGLPGEDGLELTRYLRAHWHGPIIIVTGRGDAVDRVVGLELGADDYVTKPFDLRELLARVRSVLRRSAAVAEPAPRLTPGLEFAGFQLDPAARSLKGPQGEPIELTAGEFGLLLSLAQQPNRVLSRDQLMNALHGRDNGPFDRAIDVQIGRLRRKIEADPAHPQLIKSVRGAGYLFAARVSRV